MTLLKKQIVTLAASFVHGAIMGVAFWVVTELLNANVTIVFN